MIEREKCVLFIVWDSFKTLELTESVACYLGVLIGMQWLFILEDEKRSVWRLSYSHLIGLYKSDCFRSLLK